MRVHHLNCGTLNLPGAPLVCHVLLVETEAGLVLVDTGFGLADIADPARRLGAFRHVVRPALRAEETAAHQVERLGFRREDVRHVVLTHFDMDHAGGLTDFPHARVHLTAAEAAGALHSPSRKERLRFRAVQWAHGPRLVEHGTGGESWRGFPAAQELTGIAPGLVLIALPGHTRGHAVVAVQAGDRWVLHAGDAFYHRGTLDGSAPVPIALRLLETSVAHDLRKVRANHARLAELHAGAEPDVDLICAHDPEIFARLRS